MKKIISLLLTLSVLCVPALGAERALPSERFTDVPVDQFYTDAVDWAVENGVTAGTSESTFSPDAPCTRAQAVTFLWRAAGKPAPRTELNPFADIAPGQYYSDAVAWAVENGITTGTSSDRFSPASPCTRAQIVTFLHRAAGTPGAGAAGFTDVPAGSYFDLPVRWAVQSGVTKGVSGTRFGPNQTCTRAQIVTFLYRAREIPFDPKPEPFSQYFPLYWGDTPLDEQIGCVVNRPYIRLQILTERFGLDPQAAVRQRSWPLRYGPDGEYIALSDAVKLCRLGVMFREDGTVRLYRLADYNWTPSAPAGTEKKAYIRLEDIMADGGINGSFTHEGLNKLRFFGAYLRDHAEAFYIAWIPLYVNPGAGIRNDVSRDESFYNADFVFSLDCLLDDGGRIGLHGLTHQSGDEVSAEGFEFGADKSYSRQEVLARFAQAEDICTRMGYTCSFFEFPHYAASDLQKQLAEEHFDVIYQQYDGASAFGRIETRNIGGHTCLWVPTPADCVHSTYDSDGIAARLTASHAAGKEISLYFHPVVDYRSMQVRIDLDVMRWTYYEETGILSRILRLTSSWGYRFSAIK